jgi:carboxylesterase type B
LDKIITFLFVTLSFIIMRTLSLFIAITMAELGRVAAAPAPMPSADASAAQVTVSLPDSSKITGYSALGVEAFHGIPYALPPVGNLRLKPPVRRNTSLGTFDATSIEAACPQFFVSSGGDSIITSILGDILNMPMFQTVTNQKEDCLTINVFRPKGTKAGDKLPVLFWIFGGAFEVG